MPSKSKYYPSKTPKSHTITEKRKIGLTLILKDTVFYQAKNFNLLAKLALIVVLPASIFSFLSTGNFSDNSNVITSIAGIFTVMAITWAYQNTAKANKYRINQVYTIVSGRFLQVLGAFLFITFVSFPAGVVFFVAVILSISLAEYSGFIWPVALIILFITLYLPARYTLALPILISEKITVWKGLKKSALLMRKRKTRIIIFFGLLFAVLAVIILLTYQVISIFLKDKDSTIIIALLNAIYLTFFMPLLIVFISKVYERLLEKNTSQKAG